jgi:hypothetical protein
MPMSVREMIAPHPEAGRIAAYVDSTLDPTLRPELEAHLADCALCRLEVVEVSRLVRSVPGRPSWQIIGPVAAAAALLIAVGLWQLIPDQASTGPVLREPAITTAPAPMPVAPVGQVARVASISWTSVPGADRYRLTLFDVGGEVVWETEGADTASILPAAVRLEQGESYFWKVEARTGFDRWVDSDLIEFTIAGPGR